MTPKTKLLSGLVAIFAAGVVVGGSVGFQVAKANAPKPLSQDKKHDPHGGGPGPGDFVDHMFRKLQKDLQSADPLTEEQQKQIRPVFEQVNAELKAVNAENFQRVKAIFRASHEKIKPFLTTNQVERLEQKRRERELRQDKYSPGKPKC
jgi:Spy/CpxP family protein refolding chaperone